MGARKLIGPARAHLDAPCTDACYEPADDNSLVRHTRHSESGTDDPGCPYCHAEQEREAARGDEVPRYVVTDERGLDITARLTAEYGSVQAWLDQGRALRDAFDGMVRAYVGAVGLPTRVPGEALRRQAAGCACKGGGPVCVDGTDSCPRGAALSAATFLPTLDEVRATRGKAGQ